MTTIGSHHLLDMYGCPASVIDDVERVRAALREAARLARTTLLHEVAHRFAPQGVTAVGLLAESHISVHTWPELGYAAADIFTCGEQCEPEQACRFLARALSAERHDVRVVARGSERPAQRPPRAILP